MHRFSTHSLKYFPQKFRFIISFLSILSLHTGYGQSYSFSGNIGKYPVYLKVQVNGSKVEGHYFYKSKLIDIPFAGILKAGVITLKTTDQLGDPLEEAETFQFKWPAKTPVGTWQAKGKQKLELHLFPLTEKETSSPKCSNPSFKKTYPEINDLMKVKIGLFKLKQEGAVETAGNVKIRRFKELTTNISLFRIDSGLVTEKQQKANEYLEFLHLSAFLSSLECASYSLEYGSGSDYVYAISDIAVSNDLLCFSAFAAFYCGGAHPDETSYGINYDLNTFSIIDSPDYLIAGKDELFNKRVYAYLAKSQPIYFDPNFKDEDDVQSFCEYNDPGLWTVDCDFSFTGNGLRLIPSFSHYKATCLDPEWAVIPYSELKDLIKPEYFNKMNKLKP